ncbi:aspartic peptidase domain-containing protein [Xylaria bambusicola]|uniref:aspartic peptidase domain-containing protein n=1 Tax=Xylaria bambusicola TaxID=326684 RepID=UPI002007A057|nr:aspartic peptidase domain-containing protein [Xylaria bambusicola]KAI0518261.1 aspartic peptidase domain-containing protein [Xylaria bambusicola]
MRSPSPLVLVAFLFALLAPTLASPAVTHFKRGNTFSVPLVHNADRPRHGPSEVLRTLKKFNLEIPNGLQKAVDKHHAKTAFLAAPKDGGTGTVSANSKDGDLLWLAPVSIGTPPQELFVDLDTGSTDSWFFSTDTKASEVDGQTLWEPNKSSTSALIEGCSWSIIYGDWSTSSGKCYTDTFKLGNLSIPNMTIESAESVSDMFTSTSYMSGLVGLAWPDLKQTIPPQKALIEFLPEVLDEPVFTVDFRHNSSDGSFNFGYIDDKLYESDIVYTDVDTSSGFWGVKNTAFGIGGENLTYSFLDPKPVIIDTGTTLLFAPEASVDTYYAKVPGANFSMQEYGYVVPCDAELPDFLWEFSDKAGNVVKGAVPGAYLVYAHTSDELCFAGLQSISSFTGVEGIFGDIFLKSGFFAFDIKGKRFGAAAKPLNISNGKRDMSLHGGIYNKPAKTIFI